MQIDTAKLTKNWKTTAQGLLGAGIAITLAIMTLPKGATAAVVVLACLRALVGFLQKDAQAQ